VAPRIRVQRWADLFRQFAGHDQVRAEDGIPIPVAIWQDGRGISTREAAEFAWFARITGAPAAGNHWCYTFTPRIASRACVVRFCWAQARLETSTAIIGESISAATAKAATNAVFTQGDLTGVVVTCDEVTNANLPLTLFNFRNEPGLPRFPYPEYFAEMTIPQGQVLEIYNRTQDDEFDFALGFYTQPIV